MKEFFTTSTTRSKRRLVLNAQPTSISTARGVFSVTDKVGSPVSQLTIQSLESNKSFDTMIHKRVKASTTGKYDEKKKRHNKACQICLELYNEKKKKVVST
jgi:hypothetical protein